MTVPAQQSAPMSRREWLLSDRPQSRRQARLGRAYVTWRQFTANRLAVVGLVIIIALLLIAAFANLLATHSPVVGDLKNARLLPPGSSVATGGAIQEYWAGALATGVTGGVLKTVSLEERDDVAVEEGEYEIRVGAAVAETGKYVVVHRRQPDGGWRIGLDIWNSDSAPQPV